MPQIVKLVHTEKKDNSYKDFTFNTDFDIQGPVQMTSDNLLKLHYSSDSQHGNGQSGCGK